jgi:hypothetical protein
MKSFAQVLDGLPELPVELFEFGAKLDFSKAAPVITNHPDVVTADHPPASTARINRSSFQIRLWYGWTIYPKVTCYPFPDPELVAYSRLEPGEPGEPIRADVSDLSAIARIRRYYKLSRFPDFGRAFCVVRAGPWFATVTERQSCDDQLPSIWTLESNDPGIALTWPGTWEDRPSIPNLTVWVDLNAVAKVRSECCGGFYFCPTTQSCIPISLDCPDAHPV